MVPDEPVADSIPRSGLNLRPCIRHTVCYIPDDKVAHQTYSSLCLLCSCLSRRQYRLNSASEFFRMLQKVLNAHQTASMILN